MDKLTGTVTYRVFMSITVQTFKSQYNTRHNNTFLTLSDLYMKDFPFQKAFCGFYSAKHSNFRDLSKKYISFIFPKIYSFFEHSECRMQYAVCSFPFFGNSPLDIEKPAAIFEEASYNGVS